MFFQKNDKMKSLIKKQKALKEVNYFLYKQDTYILFKGGMVSSDLIDIEVILKNNNHIRTKMLVDQKYFLNINIFKSIIIETQLNAYANE